MKITVSCSAVQWLRYFSPENNSLLWSKTKMMSTIKIYQNSAIADGKNTKTITVKDAKKLGGNASSCKILKVL